MNEKIERIHRDPALYALYNMFFNAYQKGDFTPEDVRFAAHCALMKFQETNPLPCPVTFNKERERKS